MSSPIDLEQVLHGLGPVFAENAATHDRNDRFVAGNYDALKKARVFSALVPRELGGSGLAHAEMCSFLRRLAGSCPSTALALSMHQHLVAAAAANHKAGRPGKALLEKVGMSELVLVSTGANDWLDSNGSADPVDGGYRVTAVKPFASGSPSGDVMVTSAAHDNPAEGGQVLHFPLPLTAEGVEPLDDWQSMGMRGTGSQTIRLNGVFVPEEAVVLRRVRGVFHPAFAVIVTVAMPLIMSVYLGIAEKAAEIAREKAARSAGMPGAQSLAGELENHLTAARLAVADMIGLADNYDFTPDAELASRVLTRKTLAANAAIAATAKALELAGGAGCFRRNRLEQLFRDVQAGQFHPLPEKRQQEFTGRCLLGLDPVATADSEKAGKAA